jgi:2-hydroxy-3-keto-5-methylthiopentenyl-1-phosphate phosphatase
VKDNRKKKLKKEVKEQQFKKNRDILALTPNQLDDLLGFLQKRLAACDHSFKRTLEWIISADLDTTLVCSSLRELGGCCDCEVLANVTPDKFGWE